MTAHKLTAQDLARVWEAPMKRSFLLAAVAALAINGTATSAAELSAANQAKLIANVDAYAARMSEVALKIWSLPELGYQESTTSELLQVELTAAGFRVEPGLAR